MPRKALWILAAAAAVPFLAFAALYFLVSPNELRPLLERQLTDALGRQVQLGQLSLQPIPLALRATELRIAEDAAFGSGPFATAREVMIHPRLLPLFRGQVEISRMVILEPRVELRQNARRQWNWESLGPARSTAAPSPGPRLDRLEMKDALVAVTRPAAPRAEYRRLGLSVTGYAPGQAFALSVAAETERGASLRAAGTLAPAGEKTALRQFQLSLAGLLANLEGEIGGDSWSLQVEIPSSPLAEAAPLFVPAGTAVQGTITAQIKVEGRPNAPQLRGRVAISDFSVSGGAFKQPVAMKDLRLELAPERLSLLPTEIRSGSTRLQAHGVLSHYATEAILDATLLAPAAQLPELLGIAQAYGVAIPSGVSATGEARLQLRAHGPLAGNVPLALHGSGQLKDAVLVLPELTKPLAIPAAAFRFAGDSVAFDSLAASLASTRVDGTLTATGFRSPRVVFDLRADRISLAEARTWVKASPAAAGTPPRLDLQGRLQVGRLDLDSVVLENVSAQTRYRNEQMILDPLSAKLYGGTHLGQLEIDLRPNPPLYRLHSKLERVESANLLAAATSLRGVVSGPLDAALQLSFRPGEPAALARSLQGQLNLRLSQGRLAGFNLTNELAAAAKFLGFRLSPESFTQFLAVTGDLTLVNGVARTQNLKLDLANLSAAVSGDMNLADQTLDLKILSVLDRKFSDQVGGNRIGGFMSAALMNSQGNLLIPATIKGSFQKPVMAPDAGAMAKLKLENLNTKNPQQLLDTVDSVLGIFRKKKTP